MNYEQIMEKPKLVRLWKNQNWYRESLSELWSNYGHYGHYGRFMVELCMYYVFFS